MRRTGRGTRARGMGFIPAEMVLLILMLVAFLAGVVLLVDDGVSTFDSREGDSGLSAEADRVFDGLEALLGSARAVSLEQPGLDPSFNRTRLVFIAELDGTGPMSGVLDLRENEVVEVRYTDITPRLEVLVNGGTGGAGPSTLTTMLDTDRAVPFTVEYLAPGGEALGPARVGDPQLKVGSVRVKIWLETGDRSQRFSRMIELDEPLPAAPMDLEHVI